MNKKWYKDALMVNRDPNWYNAIDISSKENCISSLENYFGAYTGNITDIMLGVFEQTALIPNDSFMWRGEKYLQTVENGIQVDHKAFTAKLYKCFAEYGVDAAQIFIEQMNKLGIRPWFSLRMNDVHRTGENYPISPLRSDMFYEELDAGHLIGKDYGYHSFGYDFKYPRYRTAVLGYIRELLSRYEVFGLELDFMRDIVCFDYRNDHDCHRIMTEYMREVRTVVSEAEKLMGHEIKISVRCARSAEQSLKFGFDMVTMCREGLVDVVVPTAKWCPTDSAIPVREWRKLLGDGIGIVAGIETNNFKRTLNLAKNSKAYAAAFYAMGADGIYYNNHEYHTDRNREAWTITRENCTKGLREFIVTEQDTATPWESRYAPLPLRLDGESVIPLDIGAVNESDKVTVTLDFEGEQAPSVSIFEKTISEHTIIEPIQAVDVDGAVITVTEHSALSYDLSGISTDCHIDIKLNGTGMVYYLSISIDNNKERG